MAGPVWQSVLSISRPIFSIETDKTVLVQYHLDDGQLPMGSPVRMCTVCVCLFVLFRPLEDGFETCIFHPTNQTILYPDHKNMLIHEAEV